MNKLFPIRRMACSALLAALFIGACQQQSPSAQNQADTTATGQSNPTSPDVAFIDSMVPHHEMAMHMAEMVIEHGSSPDVKAFAQRVKDKQAREVNEMKSARKELAGSDDTPEMDTSMMQMPMDSMMALHGSAMDQAFLSEMIPHHEMAISMAEQAQQQLTRPDLKSLAQKMIADQQKEIEEMRQLQSK